MNLFNKYVYIKKAVSIIIAFGIFICSVLTDYSNHAVEKDIRSANLRFQAVDELIRSDAFLSIPEGSDFLAGDLYNNPYNSARNLTEQSFDWAYYIGIKTGISHRVIKNEKDYIFSLRDTTKQSYYVMMQQALKDDDISMVMARVGPAAKEDTVVSTIVNHAWVLYYSKYKIFSVCFSCNTSSPVQKIPFKINHLSDTIQPGKNIEVTIYNTQRYNAATIFSIKAESIDLKSIRISNLVNPASRIFYL